MVPGPPVFLLSGDGPYKAEVERIDRQGGQLVYVISLLVGFML